MTRHSSQELSIPEPDWQETPGKWPHNRTEADQGSKREGVYTALESERFVWTYYYRRHPLGGADSESNHLCELRLMKIIFQTTFVL
jgi:hypothetical protein